MASIAKLTVKFLAGILWIYSYVSLGFFLAIASVPGFYLARWGWSQDVTWGLTGAWAEVPDVLMGMFWSIMGFFVFGLSLMVVLPLVRVIMRYLLWWKPHVGEIPVYSFRIWFWYNHNGLMFVFSTVFGRFARATSVYPWFLRAMGAKIGKQVVFNTQHVYDLDLLRVGDRTVIGANASILGHVGERNKLVRAPVTIGNNCTIGQYTNIFPGVTMGDNCHVGAMSLVPKGMTLDANAIYGGVPVRKIRDLSPGEKVTSQDVSSTTGTPKGKQLD